MVCSSRQPPAAALWEPVVRHRAIAIVLAVRFLRCQYLIHP